MGGHDGGAAGARDRLARRRLDARLARRRPPIPNARFTTPAAQCPSIAPEWEDPAGVPIDAIMFGGRRASVVPLVHEALDWEHGVFLGSIMGSETTAAAAGEVGALRFDPMAMLPFCGYHMGDYFAHWLRGRRDARAPSCRRIFMVNWFRKDDDGRFIWPGFGENSRVLAWIFRRCDGEAEAVETPIGRLPPRARSRPRAWTLSAAQLAELVRFDPEAWRAQLPQMQDHLARFGDRLPAELRRQLDELEAQVS